MEPLYKHTPETRTSPLIRTPCMVPLYIKKCTKLPLKGGHLLIQDTLSCPKGVWNRGVHKQPYNYSGTSELRTPRDHAKVSAIGRCPLYTESAPSNVTTLCSRHMPCVRKLRAPWVQRGLEEWIETAKVFKNRKYFSTLTPVWINLQNIKNLPPNKGSVD